MGGWKVFNKAADTVRKIVDPVLPEKAKQFGTQTISHAGSWAPQVAGAALTAAGLPMLGIPLAGIGGAVNNYQSTGNVGRAALAGGISGLTAAGLGTAGQGFVQGMNASAKAGGGLIGQLASGTQKALGFTPDVMKTVGGLQGPVTSAQSELGYNYLNQVPTNLLGSEAAANALGALNTVKSVSPYGAYGNPTNIAGANPTITQSVNPATGNLLGSIPSQPAVNTQVNPVQNNVTSNEVVPASTFKDKIWNEVTNPKNILGAGSLASSAMMKTPTYQTPASVEAIRSKLLSGGALTEQGQLARNELSNILKATPEQLYPTESDAYYQAATRRMEQTYADAQKQLDAQYNQAGVYGSGEHLAAKDKLNQDLINAKNDLYAQTESNNRKLAITAKYQALQQAIGVDADVMNDLVGLTGLDVQTAALMYGANAADVQAIREALGTLGVEMLVRNNQTTTNTGALK